MKFIKKLIAGRMVRRDKKRRFSVIFLEQKHTDPSIPLYNDSSFFYGGDKFGNAFIARMAFRGKDRKPEIWFDFYLKDRGFFSLKELSGFEGEGFRFGNLYWKPIITGRTWEIGYDGKMEDRNGNELDAKVNMMFTGRHPLYDFAASSDPGAIADAIADEKWNRTFFSELKELSQTHYEQTGKIEGTLKLGEETFNIDMISLRDHSFGPRSWQQWDRHFWMSGVDDDGWSWTVTTIRYHFINRLTAGFVTDPDGHTDAIVKCTGLEEISKDKLWPKNGLVEIKTRNGITHRLEFERKGHFPYLMDAAYQMLEGIGNYRFNGVPGLGMIEFGFSKGKYDVREG